MLTVVRGQQAIDLISWMSYFVRLEAFLLAEDLEINE